MSTTTARPPGHIMRFAMRWKLLITFAAAFTVIFVFIAIYVLQFSSQNAQTRLQDQLLTIAEGGAATIDKEQFVELITTVPPKPDPDNPFGLGYPDSPLYVDQATYLYKISLLAGDALPYTYFRDPADGKLYAAASSGYGFDPQIGYTFKVPTGETNTSVTNDHMERGLEGPVLQPPYTDAYGTWMSAYVPIKDASGVTIGGVGVDYPMTYVDEVVSDVQRRLFPVLVGSYALLLGLVLLLSTALVRPLRRLTDAARRMADGEYDLDVRQLVSTRFPDEMYELADAFGEMAEKVGARERSLSQEVQRLKVEIDHQKREEAVRQITDSDSFADLTQRAAEMRRRMREGSDA